MRPDIREVRILARDGRILWAEASDRGTTTAVFLAAFRSAGIASGDVAVVQGWGDPIPDCPALAPRYGRLSGWMPAPLDVAVDAYHAAGLEIDDDIPAAGGAA